MPVELPVGFGVGDQVGALVVGVPAQGLGLGEAVGVGQADLCPELYLLARLPPDDGPHVRLGDAYDPVLAPVRPVGVHFPLLVVDRAHDPEVPRHFMRQRVFLQQVQHRVDTADIAVKAVQVVTYRAPQRLFVGLSFFGLGQVFPAGHLPIGPGLDLHFAPQMVEQDIYDRLGPFPGRVEQAKVVGVGNVLVGNGGIQFELPLVPFPLSVVLALSRRTAMADGGQHIGEGIEGVVAELLPPFHEQRGGEQRIGRELVQPQKELHVGVLLDDADRLIVAQVQFVLDDQAADHDAGVDGRPAAIGEVQYIDLGALVPWEMERQTDPTVVTVQFHLVKIAEFLNFELVL